MAGTWTGLDELLWSREPLVFHWFYKGPPLFFATILRCAGGGRERARAEDAATARRNLDFPNVFMLFLGKVEICERKIGRGPGRLVGNVRLL